jgi:hypothetical protein
VTSAAPPLSAAASPPASRRVAFFGVWVLILCIGPFLRLLGVPARPSWNMYRGYNSGLCVMRTFEPVDGAAPREVDRFELLGFAGRSHEAPASLRSARDLRAAESIIKELCTKAKGPLFVEVRCGSNGKWHFDRRADHDACAPPASLKVRARDSVLERPAQDAP